MCFVCACARYLTTSEGQRLQEIASNTDCYILCIPARQITQNVSVPIRLFSCYFFCENGKSREFCLPMTKGRSAGTAKVYSLFSLYILYTLTHTHTPAEWEHENHVSIKE